MSKRQIFAGYENPQAAARNERRFILWVVPGRTRKDDEATPIRRGGAEKTALQGICLASYSNGSIVSTLGRQCGLRGLGGLRVAVGPALAFGWF